MDKKGKRQMPMEYMNNRAREQAERGKSASVDPVVMLPSDMGHCVGVIADGIDNRICPMSKTCKRYQSHRQRQNGNYRGQRQAVYLLPFVNDRGGCDNYWDLESEAT